MVEGERNNTLLLAVEDVVASKRREEKIRGTQI
jgi:hypothetical protein